MIVRRIAVVPVPAKVAAAQDYLRFAEVARCGGPGSLNSDLPSSLTRDLTTKEQAVYDAATEVLRLYFTGEHDFGPPVPDDDDEDKPPARQLTEE
jgi:hypothetical protein